MQWAYEIAKDILAEESTSKELVVDPESFRQFSDGSPIRPSLSVLFKVTDPSTGMLDYFHLHINLSNGVAYVHNSYNRVGAFRQLTAGPVGCGKPRSLEEIEAWLRA